MNFLERFLAKMHLQATDRTDTCTGADELSVVAVQRDRVFEGKETKVRGNGTQSTLPAQHETLHPTALSVLSVPHKAVCEEKTNIREVAPTHHQTLPGTQKGPDDQLPIQTLGLPPSGDLADWIALAKEAPTLEVVLRIVAEFRNRQWSDKQSAHMAMAYHQRLEALQITNIKMCANEPVKSNVQATLRQLAASGSIKDVKSVLQEFGQYHWGIVERAAMSSTYTPIALKLIAAENLDKHRTLEDLAAICWDRSDKVHNGRVALMEVGPPAKQPTAELQRAGEDAEKASQEMVPEGKRSSQTMREAELIAVYINRFINRTDIWAKQWVSHDKLRNGYAYQKPDMDTKGGLFTYEPITSDLVNCHLQGEITCGWAAIDENSCGKWLCFDSDTDDGALDKLETFLRKYNWHVIREGRRPGRDGHMWLFFDQPVPAERLIALGTAMMKRAKVCGLELFPKSLTGLSQVRGPLGINQKPDAQGARGWFDGVAHDVRSQLEWLAAQPLNRAEDAINIAKCQQSVAPAILKPPVFNSAQPGGKYSRLRILEHVAARRSGKGYVAQCPVCAKLGLDSHRDNLHIAVDGERFCCWYGGQPGRIHTARDIIKALVAGRGGAA